MGFDWPSNFNLSFVVPLGLKDYANNNELLVLFLIKFVVKMQLGILIFWVEKSILFWRRGANFLDRSKSLVVNFAMFC